MIARISDDGREQSVKEHLKNVGELAGIFLKDAGLAELGRLVGLLHDMGKYSDLFEQYITASLQGKETARGSVNHSLCGAQYIEKNFSSESLFTAQLAASAIFCHHGGLIDMTDAQGHDMYHEKYNTKYEINFDKCAERFAGEIADDKSMKALFERADNELRKIFADIINAYPQAYHPRGFQTDRGRVDGVREFAKALLEKLTFSALIDADRYDAYLFEAGEDFTAAAEKECGGNEEAFWKDISERLDSYVAALKGKELPINKLRTAISDECFKAADDEDGIYRLCVPTGGGKTLASLRYAVEHCRRFSKRRIFYFIPYQSIIDQNADVIKACAGEENVLVHHSNIINGTESDNELKAYELLTQRWNSPIVLSTMVQFMNTFYKGGTKDVRRLHSLCNSVIIFDEVQALGAEFFENCL